MDMNKHAKVALLAGLTLAVVVVVAALPPIPQWQSYHDFADQRGWGGLPNTLDVVSNLAFILVAAAGLGRLLGAARRPAFAAPRDAIPYRVFFAALGAVGCASAWYHLAPDDGRLLWDRLAMVAVFMAWVAAQFNERLGPRVGAVMLPVLLLIGTAAVVYWGVTEARGHGDLRPYGVVHLYPMVLVPLLLWLYPSRYTRGGDALVVLALYLAALAAEQLDARIYTLTGIVSGHTLKHLIGAAAALWVLHSLNRRRARPATRPGHGQEAAKDDGFPR